MAKPYLDQPTKWLKSTLMPSKDGIIKNVSSGSTPSTRNDNYWGGNIPWLTPKEITNLDGQLYVSSTERYVTHEGIASSSAKILQPGTVMLSKRAPVGCVVINSVPMATNQGFLNLECGPMIRPKYLAYWLKVNKLYLDKVANGSTYPELYKYDLFEFEIAVPTLEEQDKVVNFISSLQYVELLGVPIEQSSSTAEEMLRIHDRNKSIKAIINKIMPLMLAGEIKVDDLIG